MLCIAYTTRVPLVRRRFISTIVIYSTGNKYCNRAFRTHAHSCTPCVCVYPCTRIRTRTTEHTYHWRRLSSAIETLPGLYLNRFAGRYEYLLYTALCSSAAGALSRSCGTCGVRKGSIAVKRKEEVEDTDRRESPDQNRILSPCGRSRSPFGQVEWCGPYLRVYLARKAVHRAKTIVPCIRGSERTETHIRLFETIFQAASRTLIIKLKLQSNVPNILNWHVN